MTTNGASRRKGTTMNAAMKNLTAVLAKGGAHLGDITFWMLVEASIDRQSLESKWKAAQLPMDLLPEPPTIVKSFKLAVKETQTGLVDRLIRIAVDDEMSVVFAIVHEARHADGTLVYTQEAKVGLDLLSGTTNTDAPTHDLVTAIQTRFLALRDTHTADDVRRTITKTLQSFSAVLLRDSGAIWYVPAPNAEKLRRLQACIESIGHSKLYLLPVHDGPDASRTLGDAATKSLESDLAELKAEVESFVAAPPERAATLARRVDAFDALRGRAQLYRDVLNIQVKDLDSTLTQLGTSIEAMLKTKKT